MSTETRDVADWLRSDDARGTIMAAAGLHPDWQKKIGDALAHRYEERFGASGESAEADDDFVYTEEMSHPEDVRRARLLASPEPDEVAELLCARAEEAVYALLELLPVEGSLGEGYRVTDRVDAEVRALPEEWASAAHAVVELHAALRTVPASAVPVGGDGLVEPTYGASAQRRIPLNLLHDVRADVGGEWPAVPAARQIAEEAVRNAAPRLFAWFAGGLMSDEMVQDISSVLQSLADATDEEIAAELEHGDWVEYGARAVLSAVAARLSSTTKG